ncbi:Uncharacterized protein OBRU01_18335 [Operophtera brumata]|uniref:C2H2-type domain-containing protein n=1 Tax=Operophtera brumata TaxID=104452 RepID=A0A0L7KYM8_OPEBR|nr:Uncharacterized protein OBRU01_18335 [Operophtera brumata]
MTRSKKITEEDVPVQTTTLAILKTVKSPPPRAPAPAPVSAPDHANKGAAPGRAPVAAPADAKENKASPKSSPRTPKSASSPSSKSESCYNIFPRNERLALPCAQYKTERGYKCPNCQRCYNARKNLVRHVTLECGRDPKYRCPYCAYSKHRRNELKKHIEKKHTVLGVTPDATSTPPAPPAAHAAV